MRLLENIFDQQLSMRLFESMRYYYVQMCLLTRMYGIVKVTVCVMLLAMLRIGGEFVAMINWT